MFSTEDLEKILKVCKGQKTPDDKQGKDECNQPGGFPEINLAPGQILVIAGFLGGVLEVNSVLVNKSQDIEVVLTGSLKRPTQLDNIMSQVTKLPFETVLKSIISQLD